MRQREEKPCLKIRHDRAVPMITLRPGSHVYRLLLLLAIAGEYPMRSLHLLGSSRTLEDLVHRLGHVQDFRTSTGADLGSCKMITTSGRGERRTIRLYKSALPLLQTLHPAALAHYLDITRNHRFSGSAEHIERNHRVAETVAMCLVADVETRPFLLPVLQRQDDFHTAHGRALQPWLLLCCL